MIALLLVSIALLTSGAHATSEDKQTQFCNDSIKAIATWSAFGFGIVAVLNISIVVVIVYTMCTINKIPSECEKLTSSVHWLNRTAVRSSLGPSAKQALTDYAKSLPELVGLTGEKNIAEKKAE